ncbi:MAG: hypothetical protein GY952_07470 [Rhodobacteraceae bacterium]|nr:hypothetical protein [Paracoccaceae bacterium]
MNAVTPDDLKSRAGRILYRELPEEYRYRDQPPKKDELGDLDAFLHGAGHLLDLIRGTTEQAHADSFAEEIDGRSIQPWLVPYLAELVGAELLAPDPDQRIEELNNSVLWYKSKGTLRTVDEVSDVVSGAETVTREGWRYVLTTPRMNLPPFTYPPSGSLSATGPDDRRRVTLTMDAMSGATGHTGCPDFRHVDRAVQDPGGANPLYRLQYPARDANGHPAENTVVYWRPLHPGGVPAFPGHYDDNTARCPDMREMRLDSQIGPHPRRSIVHVQPPEGFFENGLRLVDLDDLSAFDLTGRATLTPHEVLSHLGMLGEDEIAPDKLQIQLNNDVEIASAARVTLRNLLFTGAGKFIVKQGGFLRLDVCAIRSLVLEPVPDLAGQPALEARNSLFETVTGGDSFTEMEYCTVTGLTDLARLNASDCIFAELSDNLSCSLPEADPGANPKPVSCLRYSRLDFASAAKKLRACFLLGAPANTSDMPRFIRLWFDDGAGNCVLRLPEYGEPGYGVLDTAAPASLTAGAEDDGEMGAGHGLYHAAGLRALDKKLQNFLPLGQEIAFFYDPLLAQVPPKLPAD